MNCFLFVCLFVCFGGRQGRGRVFVAVFCLFVCLFVWRVGWGGGTLFKKQILPSANRFE